MAAVYLGLEPKLSKLEPLAFRRVAREVANILASHLIGAVGTLLTLELRPSVPVLVPRDGSIALEAVSAVRRGTGSVMRVETAVRDREGLYRIPVTLFPEEP